MDGDQLGLDTQTSANGSMAPDPYWVEGILPHAPPIELSLEMIDLTHVSADGSTAVRRGQQTEVQVQITYVYTPLGGGDD